MSFIKNIVLLESYFHKNEAEIHNCLTDNTILVLYDSNKDTFETIKTKLNDIKKNYIIRGIAVFQDSEMLDDGTFQFCSDEKSVVQDVELIDPELNSWQKFTDFVYYIQNDLGVEFFDLLLCKIYSDLNWRYVIDKIELMLMTLNIRSSDDNTGHIMYDGDWVLESENVEVDMINLYFTSDILKLDLVLAAYGDQTICVMTSDRELYFVGNNKHSTYGPISNSNSYFTKVPLPSALHSDEYITVFTCQMSNNMGLLIIITNENRIFVQGNDAYGVIPDFPTSIITSWKEIDNSFLSPDENILQVGPLNIDYCQILTDHGNLYMSGKRISSSNETYIWEDGFSGVSRTADFGKLSIPNNELVVYLESGGMIVTSSNNAYEMLSGEVGYQLIQPPDLSFNIVSGFNSDFIITSDNKLYAKGNFGNFQHGLESTITTLNNYTYVTLENRIAIDLDLNTEYARYVVASWGATHVLTNLHNLINVGNSASQDTTESQRGNGITSTTNANKKKWTMITTSHDGTSLTNKIANIAVRVRSTFIITTDGYLLATGRNDTGGILGIGVNSKRKRFDWCKTALNGPKLTNVVQFFSDRQHATPTTLEPYRLVSSDTSGNRVIKTTYPSYVELITENTDSSGNTTSTNTTTTDSSGNTTSTTTDSSGNTTSTITDSSGNTTSTTTDSSGNTTSTNTTTTDTSGNTTSTTTDSSGNTTSTTTDSSGNTTSTTTDSSGNTTSTTTDSSGNTTSTNTTTTDSSGNTTSTTTDSSGNTTSTTTDASGNTTSTTTDASGDTTSTTTTTTDASGNTTSITTDASGNTTSTTTTTTDESGNTTSTTTDASGDTTSTTIDASGNTTSTTTTTTDASGDTTSTTTDSSGNVISTIVVSTNQFGDRKTVSTNEDGVTTTTIINYCGKLISSTVETVDNSGNTVQIITDSLGNTVNAVISTDEYGNTVTEGTDSNGDITIDVESSDNDGNTTTITTLPSGLIKEKVRDNIGNITIRNSNNKLTKINKDGDVTETDDPEYLPFILPTFNVTVPEISQKTTTDILNEIDDIDIDNDTITSALDIVIQEQLDSCLIPELSLGFTTNKIKVANVILDQILTKNNKRFVKVPLNDIPLNSEVKTKISNFDLCVVKPNSKISIKKTNYDINIENTALYCTINDVGSYVTIELDTGNYTIQKLNETEFSLKLGNETIGTSFVNGDIYSISSTLKIAFGSATIYTDNTGTIPCLMKGSKILTTKGYKLIENLTTKDTLIDAFNKHIKINEIKQFVSSKVPYKIRSGTKVGSYICNEDIYITQNHCIYHDQTNYYIPSSMISNQITRDDKKFNKNYIYYHIYTANFFTDTFIVNGVPCESHSKYIFLKLKDTFGSKKSIIFLNRLMTKIKMEINGKRKHISRNKFNMLFKSFKSEITKTR